MGPKERQGDGKAPEGFYYVLASHLNPVGNFHLAFNVGYPNNYDRAHGRTGGAIMVHGSCVSIGCFAMTDSSIEEIYAVANAVLRNGQPFFRVHIFPFKMTTENMEKHKGTEWCSFWENLKEGRGFPPPSTQHPSTSSGQGPHWAFHRSAPKATPQRNNARIFFLTLTRQADINAPLHH